MRAACSNVLSSYVLKHVSPCCKLSRTCFSYSLESPVILSWPKLLLDSPRKVKGVWLCRLASNTPGSALEASEIESRHAAIHNQSHQYLGRGTMQPGDCESFSCMQMPPSYFSNPGFRRNKPALGGIRSSNPLHLPFRLDAIRKRFAKAMLTPVHSSALSPPHSILPCCCTGALGKRTVHQLDPKAQLVAVTAGSSQIANGHMHGHTDNASNGSSQRAS